METEFAASETRSQASRVAGELRRMIVTCECVPGDRLHISSLAKRFEVSPGAVREALSRLSAEHLVVAIDQRGFRVSELSVEDMLDLYTTRAEIEQIAVAESVKAAGAEWRELLTESFARLQQSGRNTLIDQEVIAAHENYHRVLVSGCPSSWLRRLHETLYQASERYRFYGYQYASQSRDPVKEHEDIYRAAVAGDHELAGLLIRRHLEQTRDLLAIALRKMEPDDVLAMAG